MLFGFGNAMVDYTVPLTADNPCLEQIKAEKGGFFRTDNATFELLAQKLDVSQAVCGGSVANSLKAFAKLGGEATFFGKIGDDANGALFEQELEAYGIKSSLVKVDGQKSGCSIVFVDQDGEKTATAKRFVRRVFLIATFRGCHSYLLTGCLPKAIGSMEIVLRSKRLFRLLMLPV